MRTTNKFFAFLAVILLIGLFMPACTCNVDKEDAAGAIGKVDKYHKDQMKEGDIKLRSEIMEDTASLANTLRGMLMVYIYYDAYVNGLKENAEALKNNSANEDNQLGTEELDNYCEFIENGNEQLSEVCQMCGDIYNDTVTEFSYDIEQNLKNYVIYLDNLDSRDSLVKSTIDKSDIWISDNDDDPAKKDQVKQVKSIRDEILLRETCNAAVTNNKDKMDHYNSKEIYNVNDVLENIFEVASFDELKDVIVHEGMVTNYDAAVGEANASITDVSAAEANYNSAVDKFNSTPIVENFIDVVNSSWTWVDAAAEVYQANNPASNIVHSGIIYRDKNIYESFDKVNNIETMHNVIHMAFPDVKQAVNYESYVTQNAADLSKYMSNYVHQSSLINYENVDDLANIINPK